ncbi:lysophospholipid acyltransferase family protein [Candidatus Omnitrophota bacterium]
MMYFISRAIYEFILRFFCGFEILGRENLPSSGPYITVSNHISYSDPVIVGIACGWVRVTFMAKKELFERPLFGKYVKSLGVIPVERHSGSPEPLKKCVGLLKKGKIVGLFPEGTRSIDGNLLEPELGVGLVAAKTGAPIVPFYVTGSDKLLKRDRRTITPTKVKVRIGKPVDIRESLKIADKKKSYEDVSRKVMAAIAQLKDE